MGFSSYRLELYAKVPYKIFVLNVMLIFHKMKDFKTNDRLKLDLNEIVTLCTC